MKNNKPENAALLKNSRECLIVDVACPLGTRVGWYGWRNRKISSFRPQGPQFDPGSAEI